MTISKYILRIHKLLSNGDILLESNKKKLEEYKLSNDRYEIYFNIYLESISIFEYSNDKRRCVLYLDKNNAIRNYCHYDISIFYNLYELIVNICVKKSDIILFEEKLELLANEENYEMAERLKDTIKELKEILNISF